MKGLLSSYNIDPSTIHKAWNAKVLCLFGNPANLMGLLGLASIVDVLALVSDGLGPVCPQSSLILFCFGGKSIPPLFHCFGFPS